MSRTERKGPDRMPPPRPAASAGGSPLSGSSPRTPVLRWVGYLVPPLLVLPPLWAPTGSTQPDRGVWWTVFLVVGALAVVAGRLRYPRPAAAVAIVLNVVAAAVNGPSVAVLTATMIVLYSVGRHTDRRTTLVLAGAAALVVGAATALLLRVEWGAIRSFVQVVALIGFAAAAGDGARSRHAFVEASNERVRRAEENLESEARSRVAEERLKIARDLHDVMAHQIAVINLHAGVASQALPSRPADAERSLSTIREASRTVLSEIASLLRVLRAPDPALAPGGLETAPVSGLAQLDRLVADFEAVGLSVDRRTVGEPLDVPEPVDGVAYRVVQEALTNAHKHGSDSSALLQVEFSPGLLELNITNTVAKTAPHSHVGGTGCWARRSGWPR